MPTPSIQTLVTDAQQILNLDSISAVRSVVAVALANANTGTPLNPNLTTQQLWNEFYQVVNKPKSDIESIIANQLMKLLYSPPAPGGVGGNKQVIFNDGGVLAGAANFFWDKSTGQVSIGTSTPSSTFHTRSDGFATGAGWTSIGRFNNTAQTKGVDIGYNPGNNNAVIGALSAGAASGFEFWSFDGGWAVRGILNSTGLGVGVTPAYRGDFNGSIRSMKQGDRNSLAFIIDGNAIPAWAQRNVLGHYYNGSQDCLSIRVPSSALANTASYDIWADGTHNFYLAGGSSGSGSTGTLAARIDTSGNLTANVGNIALGTPGKGIDFSATAGTGTSELFNDYEEGTFTATLTGGTSNPTTPVTTTARYTKVGRLVTVQIEFVNISNAGASGAIAITGLPFVNGSVAATGIATLYNLATFTGSPVVYLDTGASFLAFYGNVSSSAFSSVTHNSTTSGYSTTTITYSV